MATNDIILIRRNASNVWQEIVLSSTADYVLGFDGSGNVVAKPLPSLAAHESTHRAGGSDPLPWGSLIHATGLLADRPAAAAENAGYLYFATDSNGGTVFRSNGTTWTAITVGFSNVAILDATQSFTGTNTFDNVIFDGDIQALAGGDARGNIAVDFQRFRANDSEVASGEASGLFAGGESTASGIGSIVIGGYKCVASGPFSSAFGSTYSTCSNSGSAAIATVESEVSATQSAAIGGRSARGTIAGQLCSGANDDINPYRQHTFSLKAKADTTNATPTVLAPPFGTYLSIPDGQSWLADIYVHARASGAAQYAAYHRSCLIENTAGVTQIRGAVSSIGTDVESDASMDVAITADNTNDALAITVTGVAATAIRWLATIQINQITF